MHDEEKFDVKKETVIHLTYENIIPYLDPLSNFDDDTKQYLRNLRKKSAEFRISRVNALFEELKSVWPEGTPQKFYVGLEIYSSETEDKFIELLKNRDVKDEISNVAAERYALNTGNMADIDNKEDLIRHHDALTYHDADDDDEFDIGDDGEYGTTPLTITKRGKTFNKSDMKKLAAMLKEPNQFKNWSSISKKFKNRTPEQCYNAFEKLVREGIVSRENAPKKPSFLRDDERKSDNFDDGFNHIKGLIFVSGDQKAIVGPQSELMKEYARNNPLFGCFDLITCQRIFVPAISPYGTVLDYETWMKIISSTQMDPIEMKPVTNKRQITILSQDNIQYYRNKIKNMDEMLQPVQTPLTEDQQKIQK